MTGARAFVGLVAAVAVGGTLANDLASPLFPWGPLGAASRPGSSGGEVTPRDDHPQVARATPFDAVCDPGPSRVVIEVEQGFTP
jgi:hypothetical protein